jgi:hypothetical protein
MIKNPEIYTPYDLEKILGVRPRSAVCSYSGASGIAWRVNELLGLNKDEWLTKNHPVILLIQEEVSNQYKNGRITAFSDLEVISLTKKFAPEIVKKTRWDPILEQKGLEIKVT